MLPFRCVTNASPVVPFLSYAIDALLIFFSLYLFYIVLSLGLDAFSNPRAKTGARMTRRIANVHFGLGVIGLMATVILGAAYLLDQWSISYYYCGGDLAFPAAIVFTLTMAEIVTIDVMLLRHFWRKPQPEPEPDEDCP